MFISIYRKYLHYFERPCSHGMAKKTWRHERIILCICDQQVSLGQIIFPPPPTKFFPFAAARAVEVLKTWTVKCTTPWKGSAADDTHHGTWVSVWVWVWVVLPQEEIADILGLYALCVAAFGVKSNVADSKTVTVRQPWGYELEQQEAIIFCGNLWNESNWLVRQCKKLDHNRDLEIIKPVQHIEVDWEVIVMRNSFYHLNIAKDIWGSL